MNKFLLGLLLITTLAGCLPPLPEFACDDDGPKSPLCSDEDGE